MTTGALLLAAAGVGAVVAVTAGASAEPDTARTQASPSATDGTGRDGPGREDETPLTGTTLDRVVAAVKAAYPDATVDRAETDSDGVYEAHITTADGAELIVEVGRDFAITGTQTGGRPDGREGHHGDHGTRPGDGRTGPSSGPSASPTPS